MTKGVDADFVADRDLADHGVVGMYFFFCRTVGSFRSTYLGCFSGAGRLAKILGRLASGDGGGSRNGHLA